MCEEHKHNEKVHSFADQEEQVDLFEDQKERTECEECGTISEDSDHFEKVGACADSYVGYGPYPCCWKTVCKECKFVCIVCNAVHTQGHEHDWGLDDSDYGNFHKISDDYKFMCDKCYTNEHTTLSIKVWYGISNREWLGRYD